MFIILTYFWGGGKFDPVFVQSQGFSQIFLYEIPGHFNWISE